MPPHMLSSDLHASRTQSTSQPCRCRWRCQRYRHCENSGSARRACKRTAAARLGALGRSDLYGSQLRGSADVAARRLHGCARRAACSRAGWGGGGGLSVGGAAAVRGRARRRPRRRRAFSTRVQAMVWPTGGARRRPSACGRRALLADHLHISSWISGGRGRLCCSVGLGLGCRSLRCAGAARGQHDSRRRVGRRPRRGGRARGRRHGHSGVGRQRGRRGGRAAPVRLPPLQQLRLRGHIPVWVDASWQTLSMSTAVAVTPCMSCNVSDGAAAQSAVKAPCALQLEPKHDPCTWTLEPCLAKQPRSQQVAPCH
jgi:hypothetical protein